MQFNYQARTKEGRVQVGQVEASSKEAALLLLQKHGFFVTFLETAEARKFYAKKIRLFGRTSKKDIVSFSRQLSLMFKSRIPLLEALQAVSEQTKNADFREKILTMAEDVEGGTPFSQALSRYPKIFSSFYVSMMKSGEASGTLSESLEYLANHLEREYHLLSKIRGAMIYPALIVVMVIGVLTLMVVFVIPNLATVLKESGQELPLLTRLVIGFSEFVRSWGWVLILIFGGILFFIFHYFKTLSGKKLKDRLLLRLPLIASFLEMIYVARFAENLSTLITGGLPIAQALKITGEIVGSDVYQEIISQMEEDVRRGERISSVLVRYPAKFPPLLTQMVVVGERTGTLGKSLMNVVDFYQKEIDRAIENLLSILEPVLIIFLGLIVAGLLASVLMPLYKLTTF